jgi:hypothetical protein
LFNLGIGPEGPLLVFLNPVTMVAGEDESKCGANAHTDGQVIYGQTNTCAYGCCNYSQLIIQFIPW